MKIHDLAHYLINTSKGVFYENDGDRLQRYPLSFRVGSGKATYYKASRKSMWSGAWERQITIGKKMITSKLSSYSEASLWRTANEITKYHYFKGLLTPQTLLSHTLLHEYAHYVQETSGLRRPGAVHDSGFYRCLSDLYQSGLADKLYFELCKSEEFVALTFSKNKPAEYIENNFTVGQTVSFDYKSQSQTAIILRVNRTRLTVILPCGLRMYVPKKLVTVVKAI